MAGEWKRFQLLAKSWGINPAVIDSHHSPSENDFAVHDFVKIFRINPAVIDSRYRDDARHSALWLCGLLNQISNFTFSSHGPCFYDDYTKKSKI